MSQENLNACIDTIKAITSEKTLTPSLPINVYLQESEDTFHWTSEDIPLLATIGMSEEKRLDLNVRIGACRETQSLWNKDRRTTKDAAKQWLSLSPIAYDLRDELVHKCRFAFRNSPQLLGRVSAISEGTGHPDMIQDLNDLAVLCKENQDLLTPINFDLTLLDTAAETSANCADVLAIANGSKQKGNESKDLRDKAYTYLKQSIDEFRAAGKFLFWKNPARLKGYSSDYWRSKKTVSKKDNEEPVEA
jgi:hypothetical protein